jgi:hypothetical protein
VIKIDKNVPIPANAGPTKIYPFTELEIGDSFAVPLNQRGSARQGMHREHRKGNGKRFVSRAIDNKTCRFWRIK